MLAYYVQSRFHLLHRRQNSRVKSLDVAFSGDMEECTKLNKRGATMREDGLYDLLKRIAALKRATERPCTNKVTRKAT